MRCIVSNALNCIECIDKWDEMYGTVSIALQCIECMNYPARANCTIYVRGRSIKRKQLAHTHSITIAHCALRAQCRKPSAPRALRRILPWSVIVIKHVCNMLGHRISASFHWRVSPGTPKIEQAKGDVYGTNVTVQRNARIWDYNNEHNWNNSQWERKLFHIHNNARPCVMRGTLRPPWK